MSLTLSTDDLRAVAASAHLAPSEAELRALLPGLGDLLAQGERIQSAASPEPEGISLSALRPDCAAAPRAAGERFSVPRVVRETEGGQAE